MATNAPKQNEEHGQPTIQLQIQTPRGLWNRDVPANPHKRPTYPQSTKIAQVIADAREVFKFIENDNKYTLLSGEEKLEPERTLVSYHLGENDLLILSVQGGNAFGKIEPSVSLETVTHEIEEAAAFAASAGLTIDISELSEESLRFYVTFRNREGECFFTQFDCQDYPIYPPLIEFTDELRGHSGEHRMYPNVFHATPCICMRYSRKAYQERGGPHADWRLLDWHLATPGGGAIDSIAMILSDLHAKILDASARLAS
jgi:hypothetical protein